MNQVILTTENKELVVVNVAQNKHAVFALNSKRDLKYLVFVKRGF